VGGFEPQFEFGLRNFFSHIKRQAFWKSGSKLNDKIEEYSGPLYGQHSYFTAESFILPFRRSSSLDSRYLFCCIP
jgi:hypothetical protein